MGELIFVATDNTATTILHEPNTVLQLFRSFSASFERCLCQLNLTSPGLLQQRGGPLCNCVHAAWTGNGPLWPPPGKALAQTMHKTRPVPFFSHTGPPIFWHTGPQYSVASARLVHHQLSWESASCCVGVHGRHLSPRCTPSEVQDVPPPQKYKMYP